MLRPISIKFNFGWGAYLQSCFRHFWGAIYLITANGKGQKRIGDSLRENEIKSRGIKDTKYTKDTKDTSGRDVDGFYL